jgi:hypothetical protein
VSRRGFTALTATVVLLASGAYVLIYLYRWEWHRAIITALFFVAAEIILATYLVLSRMRSLEQRLDEKLDQLTVTREPDAVVLARIREAAPEPRNPFAWLSPRNGGPHVFLPFLLGAGALVSGLAWVVEAVARSTGAPVLERRLAGQLAPLSFPSSGLLGPADVPAARPRHRPFRVAMAVTAAAIAAVLGWQVIDVMGDALQTRRDSPRSDVDTVLTVQFRGSVSNRDPVRAASSLWGTCNHVLRQRITPAEILDQGAGRIELRIAEDIGPHGRQRVIGCLQDATIDRIQASVISIDAVKRAS